MVGQGDEEDEEVVEEEGDEEDEEEGGVEEDSDPDCFDQLYFSQSKSGFVIRILCLFINSQCEQHSLCEPSFY